METGRPKRERTRRPRPPASTGRCTGAKSPPAAPESVANRARARPFVSQKSDRAPGDRATRNEQFADPLLRLNAPRRKSQSKPGAVFVRDTLAVRGNRIPRTAARQRPLSPDIKNHREHTAGPPGYRSHDNHLRPIWYRGRGPGRRDWFCKRLATDSGQGGGGGGGGDRPILPAAPFSPRNEAGHDIESHRPTPLPSGRGKKGNRPRVNVARSHAIFPERAEIGMSFFQDDGGTAEFLTQRAGGHDIEMIQKPVECRESTLGLGAALGFTPPGVGNHDGSEFGWGVGVNCSRRPGTVRESGKFFSGRAFRLRRGSSVGVRRIARNSA